MAKSIIVKSMDNCFVCGSPYTEVHHVIYGTANRKLSDKYGLIVPLCHEHHRGQTGVHFNRDFDISLKKLAQEKFEWEYGATKSFLEVFGKNYL
jgi:hypothetical protein